MGVPRKEQERQLRRRYLLDAAARVFGRKPFDEATMQEVAAEAQIGVQGLYEHFPSKQELYEQVMGHRADDFRARAEEALAGIEAPLEQLRALAEVYVRHFREQPMFLPMFIRDRVHFDWGFQSRFSGRLEQVYAEEIQRLRGIFEKAIRAGLIRPLDPAFLAQYCLGGLEASLHLARSRPGELEDACVERALECLLAGAGVRP